MRPLATISQSLTVAGCLGTNTAETQGWGTGAQARALRAFAIFALVVVPSELLCTEFDTKSLPHGESNPHLLGG